MGTAGNLALWPEVGSRMMSRVLTGQDLRDGWVIVQEGIYRYRVDQFGGMLVRSVLFEYLATEEMGTSSGVDHAQLSGTSSI